MSTRTNRSTTRYSVSQIALVVLLFAGIIAAGLVVLTYTVATAAFVLGAITARVGASVVGRIHADTDADSHTQSGRTAFTRG